MKTKKISGLILAGVMAGGMFPQTVLSAEPVNVLSLGDSITAGYGVGEGESYTELFDDGYIVNNRAVNGNTASELLLQFKNNDISAEEIKAADIITLTIGGNDMMAVMYNAMADMYNAENDPDITADDVITVMDNLSSDNLLANLPLLQCAKNLLDETNPEYLINSRDFKKALELYSVNLDEIIGHLKNCNPDAKIIVASQYNPYAEFKDKNLVGVSLNSFYAGIEDGVVQLNDVIIGNNSGDYCIADVKSAFDAETETDLYNASPELDSIVLDFHPNAAGHVLLAETFIAMMEDKTEASVEKKIFADVHPVSHWAMADIDYVYEKGMMRGTSEGMFSPDGEVTRAMLVTVLYRNEGEPAINKSIPFADVDMDSYYADAVSWAKQNEIVMGVSETEFMPDKNITREQIAAIMYRYAVYKGMDAVTMEENLHFDDADEISVYAVSAMNWAVGKGLIKGKSTSALKPQDFATRAEISAILHRFIENNK